jgi:solute carrier family 25 citrate transporter 1
MPANIKFWGVGSRIMKKEGPLALYKGLGAVVSGIVPKMAIRFFSFEAYKGMLADQHGNVSFLSTFVAGRISEGFSHETIQLICCVLLQVLEPVSRKPWSLLRQ